VKNGNNLQDISEIGRITAKKALAFNSTRTETNTKACGHRTAGTDKEHTGEMKVGN
jgi:hypothetical protein